MSTFGDRRTTFQRLHQSGCFVIPNPWDVGSARALSHLGFPALATTGPGFACALARAAWSGFLEAAKEIVERGTFTQLGRVQRSQSALYTRVIARTDPRCTIVAPALQFLYYR